MKLLLPNRRLALVVSLLAAAPLLFAQTPAAPTPVAAPAPGAAPVVSGGTIRGTVKAGNVPLPGVSVTAENNLTGKKYSTTTDITGSYTLAIPQNGRYVLRTDLTAFAPVTKQALLSAAARQQTVDFTLELASRAQQQQAREQSVAGLMGGVGGQNLNLLGAAADLIQAGGSGGDLGASLPSLAQNSDFSSGESVAVTGQNGTTNPFAGMDFSQMREDAQLNESLNGSPGGPGGGPVVMVGGGGGGFRGGGGGAGGFRVRGNFRNFKPNQPHGALFWDGGNSALNAEDFALRGQSTFQPAYDSNRFGATLFAPPYIPKLLTHDTNDILFFTLSGERSSQPFDQYATVPTAAERSGDFTGLTTPDGRRITLYDPYTGNPYGPCTTGPDAGNPDSQCIPASEIQPQASDLLRYVPSPNLSGTIQNYQRLTSAQTNTTKLGLRFIHTFGSSGGANPFMRMARQFLGQGNPGVTQSLNANFNYQHGASDDLNVFPGLGGNSQTHQYSLQLGYSIGKGRLTNNVTAGWNQTHTQVRNDFSNVQDVATADHIGGLPSSPQLWGLPNITLNQFSGLSEQQPNFQFQETLSLGEMSAWSHGSHNLRFGADIRRVYSDFIGNTNSTGTFDFTGCFTQQPGSCATGNLGGSGASGTPLYGSSLADFLLGMPQETAIQAATGETHLRANAIDAYGQDDWRARKNLTLLLGLRYEYFSPYSEEHDRLAALDVSGDFSQVATVTPHTLGPFSGKFPRDLVYPEKDNFEPRLGFALHPSRNTVLRGGYGINYTVGQYAKFVQNFAFEPPFADVQNNIVDTAAAESAVIRCTSFCLASGFPVPENAQIGAWAVNKNYRLPYVQVWNLNLQRTLPAGILLNIGYNGSKGSRLDVLSAPGRYPTTINGILTTTQPVAVNNPGLVVPYDYDDSLAFSNYNAATISARKRLSAHISLGATYTYSHAIDDASTIGGNGGTTCGGTCLAQNWQNIRAEESNSSFDVRHNVHGNFLYELPFGPNTHMLTADWLGHVLANTSLSGDFQFSSGSPLTPHYEVTSAGVATGTANSERPDRVPGVSLTAASGGLTDWFNKSAFAPPSGLYGTASRLSIPGPGIVSIDMSASKSIRFGDTKSFEMRATAENVFNTVQYSGVDSTLGSASYDQVTGAAQMRRFTFMGRYRF